MHGFAHFLPPIAADAGHQPPPFFAGAGNDLRDVGLAKRRQLFLCVPYGGLRGDELGFRARGDDAGTEGGQDVFADPFGLSEPCLGRGRIGRLPPQFGAHGALEALEGFFRQQVIANAGQQRLFGALTRDAQFRRAGAAILGGCAAVPVAIDCDHGTAALAATQQAAQQVLRMAAAFARQPAALQARLHCVEDRGVDDREFRVLADDPFRFGALLAHAAPGFRMLHPVRSVPDLATAVDGVGQDTDAASNVAMDGGCCPGASAWRRYAFRIQRARDFPGGMAVEIVAVDPTHDRGLVFTDFALAGGRDPVTERQATGARADERATGEATMGLVGEVGEVQLRHQSAQADVRLVRLARGVDAVADADQAHAGEGESAHCAGAFDAVAGESR